MNTSIFTTNLLWIIYNVIFVSFESFVSAYILPTNQDFIDNNKKTWNDAETHCQSQHNSHLLSIHDSFTFSQIRAEIHAIGKDSEDFWIGLENRNPNSGTPEYQWSDQSPFNYGTDLSGTFPWFDERPEAPSIDTKVRLWGGSASLLWDDTPETREYFWICNDEPTTLTPTLFPTVSPILTSTPTKSTKSGGLQQQQQQTTAQRGPAVYVQHSSSDEPDDINLFWKLAIIAVLIFSLCVLAYLCHTKINDALQRIKDNFNIREMSQTFSTRVQSLSQQIQNYRHNRRYTSDSRVMEEIAQTRRPRPPPPPPRRGHSAQGGDGRAAGGGRNGYDYQTPVNSPFPSNMRMMHRLQVPNHRGGDYAETVISTPTVVTIQGQSTTLKSQESAPSSMVSMGSHSLGPPEPNTQPPPEHKDIFDDLPIQLTSPTVKLSLPDIPYDKEMDINAINDHNDSELQKKRNALLPVLIPNSQSSYHKYHRDVSFDEYNDEEEGSLNERGRRHYYTTPKGENDQKEEHLNKMHEIHESVSTIIFDGGVIPNSRLLRRDVSFNVDDYKKHHEEKQNHTMIQPIHALLIGTDSNGKYNITPSAGKGDANIYEIGSNHHNPSKSTNHDDDEVDAAAHSVYVAGRILAHRYIMDKLGDHDPDHENWSNASLTSGEEEEDINRMNVFSPIGNKAYNTLSVGLKGFDSKILEDLHEESQFDGDYTETKMPYDHEDDIENGNDIEEEEEENIGGKIGHSIIMNVTPGRTDRGISDSTTVNTQIYRGDTQNYIEVSVTPETTDGETTNDDTHIHSHTDGGDEQEDEDESQQTQDSYYEATYSMN